MLIFSVSKGGYEFNSETSTLTWYGEALPCPTCHRGSLVSHGHRRRTWRDECANIHIIYIERRRCDNADCGRIHHMLPDFLLPFKRYEASCIEKAILMADVRSEDNPGCENQTIRNWMNWFTDIASRLETALQKAADQARVCLAEMRMRLPLQPLTSQQEGWLSQAFRWVVNFGTL